MADQRKRGGATRRRVGWEEVGGLAVADGAGAANLEAGGGGRESAFRRARPSPHAVIIRFYRAGPPKSAPARPHQAVYQACVARRAQKPSPCRLVHGVNAQPGQASRRAQAAGFVCRGRRGAAVQGRVRPAAEAPAGSVRPGVGRAGAGRGVRPTIPDTLRRLRPPMVSPGMGHAQLPGIAPDRPCLAPPPVRVNVAADAKRPCFLRVSHCLAPLHFPFLRPRCVYFGRPCGLAARL